MLPLSAVIDIARVTSHSLSLQQLVYRAQTSGQREQIFEQIAKRVASSSSNWLWGSDRCPFLDLPVIQTVEEQIAVFICSHGATKQSERYKNIQLNCSFYCTFVSLNRV